MGLQTIIRLVGSDLHLSVLAGLLLIVVYVFGLCLAAWAVANAWGRFQAWRRR